MSAAGRRRAMYLNTGTYQSPTWALLVRASEVTRPQSRGTSDRMFRGARNKKKVTGYMEYGITFKYQAKRGGLPDSLLTLLENSFVLDTVLDVACLNQRIVVPAGSPEIGTSAVGVRGPYVVAKFDLNENDEDGVSYDVELVEVDHEENGQLVETLAYSQSVTAAA